MLPAEPVCLFYVDRICDSFLRGTLAGNRYTREKRCIWLHTHEANEINKSILYYGAESNANTKSFYFIGKQIMVMLDNKEMTNY